MAVRWSATAPTTGMPRDAGTAFCGAPSWSARTTDPPPEATRCDSSTDEPHGEVLPTSRTRHMTDIAIIGGGAAGAAVFGELLRRPYRQGTVHWITGDRAPGRGVAYATEDDRHLLNVRAAGMGLFADRQDDFLQHASRDLGHARGA